MHTVRESSLSASARISIIFPIQYSCGSMCSPGALCRGSIVTLGYILRQRLWGACRRNETYTSLRLNWYCVPSISSTWYTSSDFYEGIRVRTILVQRPYGVRVFHFASSSTVTLSSSWRYLEVAVVRWSLRNVSLCLLRLPGIFPMFLLISVQCSVWYWPWNCAV